MVCWAELDWAAAAAAVVVAAAAAAGILSALPFEERVSTLIVVYLKGSVLVPARRACTRPDQHRQLRHSRARWSTHAGSASGLYPLLYAIFERMVSTTAENYVIWS